MIWCFANVPIYFSNTNVDRKSRTWEFGYSAAQCCSVTRSEINSRWKEKKKQKNVMLVHALTL